MHALSVLMHLHAHIFKNTFDILTTKSFVNGNKSLMIGLYWRIKTSGVIITGIKDVALSFITRGYNHIGLYPAVKTAHQPLITECKLYSIKVKENILS